MQISCGNGIWEQPPVSTFHEKGVVIECHIHVQQMFVFIFYFELAVDYSNSYSFCLYKPVYCLMQAFLNSFHHDVHSAADEAFWSERGNENNEIITAKKGKTRVGMSRARPGCQRACRNWWETIINPGINLFKDASSAVGLGVHPGNSCTSGSFEDLALPGERWFLFAEGWWGRGRGRRAQNESANYCAKSAPMIQSWFWKPTDDCHSPFPQR